MSSFVNVVFTMELAVPNSTLNTTPINAVPATNTLPATTVYYNPAFQVGTSSTPLPVPPPTTVAQVVYIKNLDPTNLITLDMTPYNGTTTAVEIPAGTVFLYFNPELHTGGGISGMSLTAATATVNAEVMVAY
jgi:hypothetical protein